MKHQFSTAFLSTISAFSALAAWQEQLDWALRVLASLVAIVAGGVAIHDWWKRYRARRAEKRRHYL